MNTLYFLGAFAAGVAMIVWTNKLVGIFGRMSWAERYFGAAGTFLAWKLIGIVCIVASFFILRGGLL